MKMIISFTECFIAVVAFGTTMAWSPNGKKLVYVAEKKVPKLKPFFTTFGKKSEEDTKEKSTDSNKNEINVNVTCAKLVHTSTSTKL